MTNKESRINFDEYAMKVCHAVALRATCRHRDQGAIIVHDRRIVSAGYNGAPPGVEDCLQKGYCSKAEHLPCLAEGLHGESNALLSAAKAGVEVEGATLYCLYSPCRACCNMIKTAGIKAVVYEQVYDGFAEGPKYLSHLGVTTYILNNGGRVIV